MHVGTLNGKHQQRSMLKLLKNLEDDVASTLPPFHIGTRIRSTVVFLCTAGGKESRGHVVGPRVGCWAGPAAARRAPRAPRALSQSRRESHAQLTSRLPLALW